jgi:hypothetical protein
VAGVASGNAGLDDVIKPGATSGTFTLTDTATNKVYTFHATGLNPDDYYASVGSLKAFGQVDPTTGAFTPLLSADNVPGFNFSSPHGVSFAADPAPEVADKGGGKDGDGLASLGDMLRRVKNDDPHFGGMLDQGTIGQGPTSGAYVGQTALMSHYMAAFTMPGGQLGGNVIADAHQEPPNMAIPRPA